MRRYLAASAFVLAAAISAPAAATVFTYGATLNGASEAPPNASTGTGSVLVTIDDVANTMRVEASFQDLLGLSTAAHIHVIDGPGDTTGDTIGPVATMLPSFTGFPLAAMAGSFDATYDMDDAASYRAAFITAAGGTVDSARLALFDAIADGRAYFNIHSTLFPAGEIRGFLSEVPEPSTYAMLALGLGLLAWGARRRVH